MGILDNLEAYLDKVESCYFCQNMAKYNDVAEVDKNKYTMVGVCERHSFKGLTS